MFKNKLVGIALSLALALSIVAAPKRADAGIGAFIWYFSGGVAIPVAVPVMVLGAISVAAGVAIDSTRPAPGSHDARVSRALTVVGILLLDGNEGGRDLAFTTLTAEQGRRIGASPEGVQAYNDELDRLNAIRETVAAELVSGGKAPTSERAQALWNEYRGEVSPLAFDVAARVGAQALVND